MDKFAPPFRCVAFRTGCGAGGTTLSYRDNVNAGTATVAVVGKGNYCGPVSRGFVISRAENTAKASVKLKTVKLSKVKRKARVAECLDELVQRAK